MSQATITTKATLSQRTRSIQRVLWVVLFLNLGVAAAKYLYGSMTGSSAMQADGIHSVFDSAGNVVGLIGIAIASRPADDSHPYGHAKFETYASLIIGVLLVFAAIEVGTSAIGKLISGDYSAQVTPLSFVVMVVTLCVNLGVTFIERKQAKKLKSSVLSADASHTLSDALVSIGVIIGLVFVSLGFPIADPLVALIVMFAIIYTAYDVFRTGLTTLSDHARIPNEDINAVIHDIPGVKSTHHIRTRGTENEVYVDLHVLVDPNMTVRDAHVLSDTVEKRIYRAFPQVYETLIHIEPNDGHVD